MLQPIDVAFAPSAMALATLLRRIVAEAPVAHAPLIASLRAH